LIVNLDNGNPADLGDAAWRTGLFAICTAVEHDQQTTLSLMQTLRDKCWRNGRPIRHPKLGSDYSRDQFIPQMAACYYGWKYGNDDVKKVSKELMGKFVTVLLANNWRLNDGYAATVFPPGRAVVRMHLLLSQLDHDNLLRSIGRAVSVGPFTTAPYPPTAERPTRTGRAWASTNPYRQGLSCSESNLCCEKGSP